MIRYESAHCEQLPQIRAPGVSRWPSDVGLPVWLCCYKSYHLAGSAVISPPALTRETLASMSVSVRAQLLLFLISLSSIVARSRFIEVRVLTVKSGRKVQEGTSNLFPCCFQEDDGTDGLYSLLSMDQKRQSEDFIFRRPLSKCSRLMVRSRGNFVHYARSNCAIYLH